VKQDFKEFLGITGGGGGHHHSRHHRKRNSFLSKPLQYYELKLFSVLNFQTTVPLKFILPHMDSIFNIMDTNMADYLGESYNDFCAHRRVAMRNHLAFLKQQH
jgi:hypothetical protein